MAFYHPKLNNAPLGTEPRTLLVSVFSFHSSDQTSHCITHQSIPMRSSPLSQRSPNCPSSTCSRNVYELVCEVCVQRTAGRTRMPTRVFMWVEVTSSQTCLPTHASPTVKASFSSLVKDVSNLFSWITLIVHLCTIHCLMACVCVCVFYHQQ